MSRSETWMNTTINFVESFDDVMAKGQQFFVCAQGHGRVSPFNRYLFTTVPANRAPCTQWQRSSPMLWLYHAPLVH